MSRSKAIGTQAETWVTRWFKDNGYPHAKRLALNGMHDLGDVHLGDGIPLVIEVKGGHAAENATDLQLEKWMTELSVEMRNARDARGYDHYGVLIVKRKAHGQAQVGTWYAIPQMEGQYLVRWLLEDWLDHHERFFNDNREAIRNSWEDDE